MMSLVEAVFLKRAAEQAHAARFTSPDELRRRNGRHGGRPPVLINRILEATTPGEHITAAGLHAKVPHSRKAISRALDYLRKTKRVKKIGYGLYEVTR